MSLTEIIAVRDAVQKLCEAIDAGEFVPTELEMIEASEAVMTLAGPLRHDLLCMLAARCEIGREALRKIAQ